MSYVANVVPFTEQSLIYLEYIVQILIYDNLQIQIRIRLPVKKTSRIKQVKYFENGITKGSNVPRLENAG